MLALAVVGASAGCGSREPRTDAERLARGKEIIGQMSAALTAMKAFSVETHEVRDEAKRGAQTLTRLTVVRRPDRAYYKVTGDRGSETWYDGVGLTVAMHDSKVFGQARMPETLDGTLDAMVERYGIRLPLSDLLRSAPEKALLSETTTGGWVGREQIDGKAVDHLKFADRGVNWEVWVSVDAPRLPLRALVETPNDNRLKKADVTFSNWNAAPTITAETFEPRVPADYEGIAMVQRAAVLAHIPEGEK